jgi:putative Ca2+/H+ antiporter (TMEM165/GDT1 family)
VQDVVIALTVFGIVFVGELPDKTAVASLVLGARYRPHLVFLGVAAAFTIHVTVAVLLGGLLAQLPRTPVEVVTGVLFLVGAVLLLRSDREVIGASFLVVLVAELGDLTQILTATLAARYGSPLAVGTGALLALWSVAGLAAVFGRTLLRWVPLRRVQQVAALALIALSALSLTSAALR